MLVMVVSSHAVNVTKVPRLIATPNKMPPSSLKKEGDSLHIRQTYFVSPRISLRKKCSAKS